MTRVLLAGAASADTTLAATLRQEGYDACATPERSAPCAADLAGIDVVLYGTRDGSVDDRLEFLKQQPDVPVIVLSRNPDPRSVVSAMRAGATDYLVRPFETTELCASVEQAHAQSQRHRNVQPAETLISTMLGESKPMQQLIEQIQRVGPTQTPVLIQGETGSGKELVAKAVHTSSSRSHLPMIVMNCAAIPESLQEAELFGQAHGGPAASAGGPAASAGGQIGLLETSHNSSLFLDDVAELTPSSQAKLLRVLQTGENRRLGANTTQPADVRLICACQRDLGKLVAAGQFREDLFYRLNVVSLVPPPLRERGSDILRLAQHFLERSARKLGRGETALTSEALKAIENYSWPGNVREMENAIERAVILAADNQITPELLAIDVSIEPPTSGPTQATENSDPNISLEDYFVKFVTENQDQCTETELAERLGISRKSLWERRQRLNIPRKRTKKRAPRRS